LKKTSLASNTVFQVPNKQYDKVTIAGTQNKTNTKTNTQNKTLQDNTVKGHLREQLTYHRHIAILQKDVKQRILLNIVHNKTGWNVMTQEY
jgi:hypothetical protein